MKNQIKEFTDLNAWKESHAIVIDIYSLTRKFPREEQFGLTSQIRRAAVSAVSNIAEGFGRNTAKDKGRFYSVAKGSLLEVQSQLIVAKDLGYISESDLKALSEKIVLAIRLVSGLVKSSMDRPNTNTRS